MKEFTDAKTKVKTKALLVKTTSRQPEVTIAQIHIKYTPKTNSKMGREVSVRFR